MLDMVDGIMFSALDELIKYLTEEYDYVSDAWLHSDSFRDINLKKKQVADIEDDDMIMAAIFDYRQFMQKHQAELIVGLSSLQTDTSVITSRIKEPNSIQSKVSTYLRRDNKGRVPINKCFNDIFGIRIIIDSTFSFDQLKDHIENEFTGLKLINSTKNGYIAYHIYFRKSNKVFPWELQIWEKCNERNNIESHHKYKQGYTIWEANHRKY